MPGLAGIRAIKDVKSWLDTDWQQANTDGIKPSIKLETEVTESQKNTGDFVIINFVTEIPVPFGIGGADWRHDVPLSITCRTKKQVTGETYLDHLEKMANEVARIIKARVKQAGYALVTPTGVVNKSKEPYDPFILDLAVTLVKINP